MLLLTSGTGTWTKTSGPGNAFFTPDSNQPDATVTVDQFGEYTFAWTEVNSTCSSQGLIDVTFHDLPPVYAGKDTIICEGSSVKLEALGTGSFLWSPEQLFVDPGVQSPVANPILTGMFKVVLTDQFGCINSDSLRIEVLDKPVVDAGPDQTLEYLFGTSLAAQLGLDETGKWSVYSGSGIFSDLNDPLTDVTNLSLHKNILLWTVTNGVCKPLSDTLLITVNDLKIPTLITPNGDEKNEYFVLRGIQTLGKTELYVFDRRGVQVYKNLNYNNEWNGVDYNGNDLPDDTYFLVLKAKNGLSVSSYIVIRR